MEEGDSYGYKDLLAIVNGSLTMIFTEYLEAVKNGLRYKLNRYAKILRKNTRARQ